MSLYLRDMIGIPSGDVGVRARSLPDSLRTLQSFTRDT